MSRNEMPSWLWSQNSISVYQINEKQFLHILIGFRNSDYPWLFTEESPEKGQKALGTRLCSFGRARQNGR